MRNRLGCRTRVIIVLLLLAGAAGARAVFVSGPTGVTRQNFLQLANGMTEREVETVFGEEGVPWFPPMSTRRIVAHKYWVGDGIAYVVFDRDTGLCDKVWHEEGYASATRQRLESVRRGTVYSQVSEIVGRPPNRAVGNWLERIETWVDIDGSGTLHSRQGSVIEVDWQGCTNEAAEDQYRHPFGRFIRRFLGCGP